MKTQDKIYAVVFAASLVMLAGMITQNVRLSLMPETGKKPVNVAEVKAGIVKAGLVPHEAQYWTAIK